MQGSYILFCAGCGTSLKLNHLDTADQSQFIADDFRTALEAHRPECPVYNVHETLQPLHAHMT